MTNHFEPVGRFRACPTYMPRETAQGYLARLCAFFGCSSLKEFCDDFMLDLKGIQYGEPEALRHLAVLTGADFTEMAQWSPKRIDAYHTELNGQILPAKWAARRQIRICPACADEDVAASPDQPLDQAVYMRSEWTVGLIECCPRHNMRLVQHLAPPATVARQDVGYELLNLLEQLGHLPREEASLDPFQRYILGRLQILPHSPSPLLDAISLIYVSQVCSAAGTDLLKYRGVRNGSPALRKAIGFEVIGYGPGGFERAILEMRKGITLAQIAHSLIPRLSIALSMFKEAAGIALLTDAVTAVCFKALPYAQWEELLGRSCTVQRLHYFHSAVRHYDVSEDRLQAFIVGTPELAEQIGRRQRDTIVRADVAEQLFNGRTPFITTNALINNAGTRSGNPKKAVMGFIEAGIISPEPGACAKTAPAFFSEPGFADDMKRFYSRFELVDPFAPGMRKVDSLAAIHKVLIPDLWKVLASGKVKRMGLVPGEGMLSAMRFDVVEVLSALTGVADPLTIKQVAKILTVQMANVRFLIYGGMLKPDAYLRDNAAFPIYVFKLATVMAFQAEYVVAKNTKVIVDGISISDALNKRGIEPAIDLENRYVGKGGRTIFYRREDVNQELTRMKLSSSTGS